MGDLVYRQPGPVTLQDLLAQAQNDQAGSVPPPPQPSQSSQIDAGGLSPQEHQKLLDILFAPEDPGPAPKVDKPKLLGQLLTGFGDAVTTYASILGNSPSTRTNAFSDYMNKFERQKADLQKYQEKVAEGRNRSKQRTASYLLNEQDRRQMKADALQGQKDLQAANLADRELARKERQQQIDAELKAKKDQFDEQKKWDLEMEKARYGHEQAVAGLRLKRTEGDKAAAEDQKNLGTIMGHIGGLAEVAPVALSGGNPASGIPAMTPEQIVERVRHLINAQQFGPEAKKAAEDYFTSEIGPILREVQIKKMNDELAAQGPQQQAPNVWDKLGLGPKAFGK